MNAPRDTALEPMIDKARSRIAVGGAFFMHGLCFSSWGARIPAIQQKLALSEAELGSVLFAVPAGLLVSMPATSWLVARFGSKKILTLGILLYSITLVTLGLAANKLQLVAFLAAFGMVSNFVNVSVNTQAVAVESLYKKSIMASFHGLWSLAGFVGAAIGTAMIGMEIAPPLHFLAIMAVALTGVFTLFGSLVREGPNANSRGSSFTLPDKTLVVLGLIAFFSMICEGTMFDWSGVYFKKIVLAEQAWIGAGYTAFMSTMAGTRFIADRFVSRFGLARVLILSGLLTALGLMIAVAFPYLPSAIIGFLLVGAGVSAVVPLTFSAAGKSTSLPPSSAIAAVSTIGFIGFLIGPPLIGWIAGASSLRVSFAAVAVMGCGIALLSAGVKRK